MAIHCGVVQRGVHPAVRTDSNQLEMTMTKHEIDDMMRNLPSQRGYYYEEPLWEKILGGLAFVLFVLILCFM